MFALGGYLERSFGTFKVLAITQAALVLRFLYYAVLRNPYWIFPCEILHGFTFAVMWQCSCSYANSVSSKHNQSSLQALLEVTILYYHYYHYYHYYNHPRVYIGE